ncbi:hypothetical protein [Mycobacterium sp. 1245852.3]|uniref:hypothetical protein n=1 Tax=Mycobacterium sp. 1245852.3 TaxID=1856860 RepID=UPI0012EA6EE7|nr:hypothetical protein [Mycobacterium sp. 1245852.3]
MQSDDVVDPADAALDRMLGLMADNTEDEERRERILDLMLTLPPIIEWPQEAIEMWRNVYEYCRSLRRDLEQRNLEQMYNADGD